MVNVQFIRRIHNEPMQIHVFPFYSGSGIWFASFALRARREMDAPRMLVYTPVILHAYYSNKALSQLNNSAFHYVADRLGCGLFLADFFAIASRFLARAINSFA